jgi:RNase adapter protein RapZ
VNAAREPAGPAVTRVVLVTGLSGAGKASILRTLEDLGYEAIDNPPLPLIEEMVSRTEAVTPGAERRIAIGVDARSRGFNADSVLSTLTRLRMNPAIKPELVFAWADEAALLRRFTETRRRHPLSPRGSVTDGIKAEQVLTASLHQGADMLIDTTDLPVPGLRRIIEQRFGHAAGSMAREGLSVALVSFAFPAGLPREADMVFDARFLRNPHYVPELKAKTGIDSTVGAYVEADPDYRRFFTQMVDMLGLLLPRFVEEGKKYVTIAVGCTGGRHRSVHITEQLTAHLAQAGWQVSTTHRELARGGAPGARVEGRNDGAMVAAPFVQAQEA